LSINSKANSPKNFTFAIFERYLK